MNQHQIFGQAWLERNGDHSRFADRLFRWELLPHPPYSPDLAPSDFFLFPKLKEHLKGFCFNDTNEAKQAAKTWLTKWSADYFKNRIKGWKHHLEKCINLDGDCVEKFIDCINKL